MRFEKVSCKLTKYAPSMSKKEIDHLLPMVDQGKLSLELLALRIKEFTGGEIKNIDENVLRSFTEKKYVSMDNSGKYAEITEKGIHAVVSDLTIVKRWDGEEVLRRWRRVIYNNKNIRSDSFLEEKILEKLLEKAELSLDDLTREMSCDMEELLVLEGRFGYRIMGKSHIIRGTHFLDRLARIICEKRISYNIEEAGGLEEKVKNYFSALRPKLREISEKRYKNACESAGAERSCPIGLSGKCANVFKSDGDSEIPQRHLSTSGVTITVKQGLRYMGLDKKNYSTTKLIAEITQQLQKGFEEGIELKGSVSEIINLLNKVREEMERMSGQTGIALCWKLKGVEAEITVRGGGGVKIIYPSLGQDKKNKIGATCYGDIRESIEYIRSYGSNDPES